MRIFKKVLWLGAILLMNAPEVAAWAPLQVEPQAIEINESDTVKVVGAVEDLILTDLPEWQEFEKNPRVSGDLLKARFAKLQKNVPLTYDKSSHEFVEFFIYKREKFTRTMMELMPLYFPIFEKALQKHGLPVELKYLSMIESGLNPKAISRARAGGLWQFMPATGREFGLKQDGYVDERFDPIKSTEAACRYLKQLYRIFGDWELALASYNTGPGNIKRAMRRSQGDTFWTIYDVLPKETRSYVPQYVAMNYMMNYGHDHGIFPDKMEYEIPHDTIHINGYINLNTFCETSGIEREELNKLNPHIIKTTLPESTRDLVLKVPSVRYTFFLANRDIIMDSCGKKYSGMSMMAKVDSTRKDSLGNYLVVLVPRPREIEEDEGDDDNTLTKKVSHLVRRGENLQLISNKFKVTPAQVKKWNKLRSNSIRKGQRLVIYQKVKQPAVGKEKVELAKLNSTQVDNSSTVVQERKKPENIQEKKYHVVKKGENLQSIAKKHGIEIAELKQWNKLNSSKILGGQKLVVYQNQELTAKGKSYTSEEATVKELAVSTTTNPEVQVESTKADAGVSSSTKTLIEKVYHVVSKGENLQIIAKKYGVKIAEIQEWNSLPNTKLSIGQNLIVSLTNNSRNEAIQEKVTLNQKEPAENSVKAKPSIKQQYHTVQQGDTLWTISQRYGLDINSLKRKNNIKGNAIKPGQKLIITT